jgi:hypothetical protein
VPSRRTDSTPSARKNVVKRRPSGAIIDIERLNADFEEISMDADGQPIRRVVRVRSSRTSVLKLSPALWGLIIGVVIIWLEHEFALNLLRSLGDWLKEVLFA